MSFKIKRVGHLVLNVKNLEQSRRFFTEILGFPQVGDNGRGMLFFSTAGDTRKRETAKQNSKCSHVVNCAAFAFQTARTKRARRISEIP